MSSVKIEINDIGYEGLSMFSESLPEGTITLHFKDVTSIGQLQEVFKLMAITMGFTYVVAVECDTARRVKEREEV
jgi:hypothetical protein